MNSQENIIYEKNVSAFQFGMGDRSSKTRLALCSNTLFIQTKRMEHIPSSMKNHDEPTTKKKKTKRHKKQEYMTYHVKYMLRFYNDKEKEQKKMTQKITSSALQSFILLLL